MRRWAGIISSRSRVYGISSDCKSLCRYNMLNSDLNYNFCHCLLIIIIDIILQYLFENVKNKFGKRHYFRWRVDNPFWMWWASRDVFLKVLSEVEWARQLKCSLTGWILQLLSCGKDPWCIFQSYHASRSHAASSKDADTWICHITYRKDSSMARYIYSLIVATQDPGDYSSWHLI